MRTVIVGASAAGLGTAEALRNRGYDGTIILLGDEPHLPYDRPPLSKKILAGEWGPERARLRDFDAIERLDVRLMLGHKAIGLERTERRVLVDGGKTIGYDTLVIATGVRARRLAGAELTGVHVLRTLDDALALRAELRTGPKVVVVGAGFLGAEVAAVARQLGLDVTLVDPLPLPMRRQVGEVVAGLVGRMHHHHGVALRCGVGMSRLVPEAGRVVGVDLADGTRLEADLVVLAVGSTPTTEWLTDSGLSLGDGVECDSFCRAAPGIYAAGDIASWHNEHFGVRMRVEHRTNATEQAMAVADALLGKEAPFMPIPYFWTNQYDTLIQAYGAFPEGAEFRILFGHPAEHRFVAAYGHQGRVVGVLGWNSPRELRILRRHVVELTPWSDEAMCKRAS